MDVPKAIHITNMLGISNVPDYYTCAGGEDIHTVFMVHFCLHNILVMSIFEFWKCIKIIQLYHNKMQILTVNESKDMLVLKHKTNVDYTLIEI